MSPQSEEKVRVNDTLLFASREREWLFGFLLIDPPFSCFYNRCVVGKTR
ncbi:hypothetical protein ACU4GD_18925 [Cupriavidus basilensis]